MVTEHSTPAPMPRARAASRAVSGFSKSWAPIKNAPNMPTVRMAWRVPNTRLRRAWWWVISAPSAVCGTSNSVKAV